MAFGPGHGHIHEPPLLLDAVRDIKGFPVGKEISAILK